MLYRNLLRDRAAHAPVKVRVWESANFAPSGFYIDVQIGLFRREAETLWRDELTEGYEFIERKAITDDALGSFDFDLAVEQESKRIVFAECHKGQGAAYTTDRDNIRILFAVPNSPEAMAAVYAILSGQAQGCRVDYKTYYDSPDYVRRNGRLKGIKVNGKTILIYRVKRIAAITGFTILTGYTPLRLDKLRAYCIDHTPLWQLQAYSVDHSDRVAENGKRLLVPGANPNVIIAFAYLHDAERDNTETDPGHGHRAALLIDRIRHEYLAELNDTEIDVLKQACRQHSETHKTGNPTIDICFDADRLDLPRLGIIPTPEQMATEKGAQLVKELSSPAPV